MRYSDALGKPHSLFYLLFARELFDSVCFQYSFAVYVSCYEILCEFSLGFANNVDVGVRGLHHLIDHLACNLRAGSEIERFLFEEYLMNFRNNFTSKSEGFK